MSGRGLGRGAAGEEGRSVVVLGIDLAWGERRPDGVCAARYDPADGTAVIEAHVYSVGDDALVQLAAEFCPAGRGALLAIDAPIVCPNATGSRPVDRLAQVRFRRWHAGCHPANSMLCPRPPRLLARLVAEQGFAAGWDAAGVLAGARLAAEVYPHPAMVRLFGLERILKYKRGPVVERRAEFGRLQGLLSDLLRQEFGWVRLGAGTEELLGLPWSKPVEDAVDALFCALLGLRHLRYGGVCSEVMGDLDTGFILLPTI